MTDSEQRYLLAVKRLPCVICLFRLGLNNGGGGEAHHCGEHRDHYYVASLCSAHHRGSQGVHGMHRRAFNTFWRVDDARLVAWTTRLYVEGGDGQESAF